MTIKLRDRLSFRQAMIAVSIALFLGVLFTAAHIYVDFHIEKSNVDEAVKLHLRAAEKSAAQAVFSLDSRRGESVTIGLLEYPPIFRAQIVDELGNVLINTVHGDRQSSRNWYLSLFNVERESVYSVPIDVGGLTGSVGYMTIWVDNRIALQDFFNRTGIIVVSGFIQSIVLAVVLVIVFYFLLTKKLTRITDKIGATSSLIGSSTHIDLQDFRRPDELRLLSTAFNRYNDEISHFLGERRENEKRFKDFAEASSDWFWEMDADLRYTYFSDRYEELTAYAIADRIGTQRWDFADPDEPVEKWAAHKVDLEARRPFKNFEFHTDTDHTERLHLRVSGIPIFDDDGTFKGYRGTTTDITETSKLAAQLNQSQRMEAVGQLTGGLSHDFNNLLGIMVGNVEMLGRRLGDDEKAKRNLEQIKIAIRRATSLTQRLLVFSRNQDLSSVPTDVTGLIVGLDDMLQRTLGETIELIIESNTDLWVATIDPHQFENALLNLVINARDAMPGGGTLAIEASNITLDDTYVEYRDVRPGDYVVVAVNDTGAGISPAVLEKVFDPFFTTKEVGEGSGLGLSMVFGFTKQSAGHVTIYSEEGYGTTVKLYMPRSDKAATQDEDMEEEPEFERGTERILVVEDDEILREVPVKILTEQGYDVAEAKDGPEAIGHLQEKSFDLLFTDVVLPGGMDGVEIARQAKVIQPDIKVIYTTGYSENTVIRNHQINPDVTLIRKPYDRVTLLQKVGELFGHSKV